MRSVQGGRTVQPSTIAMTCALVYAHPALMPLFSANVIDNEGEVLSHLVLSGCMRSGSR